MEFLTFRVYVLCICVWLNIWTMCCTIYGVAILRANVLRCFFLSYMLCFNVFHLCFQFYMYKVSTLWTNQWQQYVWFLLNFLDYFWALEAPKPTKSVLLKTGLVNRQNRLVYRISVQYTNRIQTFHQFEICTSFWPVLSVFSETNKTGPIWFSNLCHFLKPWAHVRACNSLTRPYLRGSHHASLINTHAPTAIVFTYVKPLGENRWDGQKRHIFYFHIHIFR
jgi:hypothetical protein